MPARHLLILLDGDTTSTDGIPRGPMGQRIKALGKSLTGFKFKIKIMTNLPKLDPKYFNGQEDLRMLHDFCHAIAEGKVDDEFIRKYKKKKPFKGNGARWRTLFINAYNDFTRNPRPSKNWIIFITFLSQAYVPAVFDVVLKPHAKFAATNYYNYYRRTYIALKPFPGYFEKIEKYFVINGYNSHPEQVTLSAFLSGDIELATRAFEIIEAAIEHNKNRTDIRKYYPPSADKLNPEAENVLDLLHWDKLEKDYITVSPLLYPRFSLERLRRVLNGEELDIGNFLNHR